MLLPKIRIKYVFSSTQKSWDLESDGQSESGYFRSGVVQSTESQGYSWADLENYLNTAENHPGTWVEVPQKKL